MVARGLTRRRVAARANRPHHSRPLSGTGGLYQPLDDAQCQQIDQAAQALMVDLGFLHAPQRVVALVCDHGGKLRHHRLCFAPDSLKNVLADLGQRGLGGQTLAGQRPEYDLVLAGKRVCVGTGGGFGQAAPLMVDNGSLRPGTSQDILAASRLVQQLEHYAFFSTPMMARDIDDPVLQDVHAAYASCAGTQKPVIARAHSPEAVAQIHHLCAMIAGSDSAFAARPFLWLNVDAVAPPMRFDRRAVSVLLAAAERGFPLQISTLSQRGASSSVSIAACVAQTVAETLACMVLAYWVNPKASLMFSPNALTTDLRSGVMAGGSGEQALLSAASVRMGQYYGLINATMAGVSNSMTADYQAGAEKALNVVLCAQAGANVITHAGGVTGSGMAGDLLSYVIDHDMLGAVHASLRPIDTAHISLESIHRAICEKGNFLGQPETLELMQSDFTYPLVFRRDTIDQHCLGATALQDAQQLLAQYLERPVVPSWDQAVDRAVRQRWKISSRLAG